MAKIFLQLAILSLVVTIDNGVLAVAVTPATPLTASMNDYVWIALDKKSEADHHQDDCHNNNSNNSDKDDSYSTLHPDLHCLYPTHGRIDNELSKKWGMSDKVIREKDTLYVTVPNRQYPLIFKDDAYIYDDPENIYKSYYFLEQYDKSQQLLYLQNHSTVSKKDVIVDLATGFWQDFYGSHLQLSPNKQYAANFDRDAELTRDINIWERHQDGYYKGYFHPIDKLKNQEQLRQLDYDYYQTDSTHEVENLRQITWVNNNKFYVDYFHKIHDEDTVAFHIRHTFLHDAVSGQWYMKVASQPHTK
ncbi:hypothetical protein [Psychrobacter sp. I-STPA10]|uniref:hypothetical protein n=1 Tax=Psychrobacter sp. I-STPA10 TaxID=2585769 RepID=UPI001E5A71BA|nr:hypothetical protein [Psychrobacter sp. I-STPA10]